MFVCLRGPLPFYVIIECVPISQFSLLPSLFRLTFYTKTSMDLEKKIEYFAVSVHFLHRGFQGRSHHLLFLFFFMFVGIFKLTSVRNCAFAKLYHNLKNRYLKKLIWILCFMIAWSNRHLIVSSYLLIFFVFSNWVYLFLKEKKAEMLGNILRRFYHFATCT